MKSRILIRFPDFLCLNWFLCEIQRFSYNNKPLSQFLRSSEGPAHRPFMWVIIDELVIWCYPMFAAMLVRELHSRWSLFEERVQQL